MSNSTVISMATGIVRPSQLTIDGVTYNFKFELEPLMQMEIDSDVDVIDGSLFRNGMKLRMLVRLMVAGLTYSGSTWAGVGKPLAEQLTLIAHGIDLSDAPGMLKAMTAEFERCFPKATEIANKLAGNGQATGNATGVVPGESRQ